MILSKGRKIFMVVNYIILALICISIILPCVHIVSLSVSSKEAITFGDVRFIPKGFNLKAYTDTLSSMIFKRALYNSVFLTICITVLSLLIMVMASYSLSKDFFGKKVVNYYFVITMYFSGGLIPTYLLITKTLKLTNNYLAIILPALVNVFYIVIIRTQIQQVPESLIESAWLDGAKEYQVLFKIIMPVIRPTLAAIGMFVALGAWNIWFNVMVYTPKQECWTLQYYLRQIITDPSLSAKEVEGGADIIASRKLAHPKNYQSAAIVLVALPVVLIYPFVQKYFVKGMFVGSVKG
jgi:putative aldouronate transport system permease protein